MIKRFWFVIFTWRHYNFQFIFSIFAINLQLERIRLYKSSPSSADLPNPGIESGSPALQAGPSPTELSGKPIM